LRQIRTSVSICTARRLLKIALFYIFGSKAGDQCKEDPSCRSATCSFDGDHLNYWFRQPVPVYAALVPSEWPVVVEPAIHIIDVTTQVLQNQHYLGQQSITLKSDYSWQVGDRGSVVEFLKQVVPATVSRMEQRSPSFVAAHRPLMCRKPRLLLEGVLATGHWTRCVCRGATGYHWEVPAHKG
jgi:hypothetical protein